MGLQTLLNRLQGEVRVRVQAEFPERILNLCGTQGISFWDLQWAGPGEFLCTLHRQDWRALRELGDLAGCTVTVEHTRGAPFFLGRFRRRTVLLSGLAACAAALFFGSFFIWDFRIEGNAAVPDEAILRALEQCGVGYGTFGFSLDAEDVRNHVLLEMSELSWITVNVSGCVAQVQVRERIPRPALDDRVTPCNIVARRDGLVRKISALSGQRQVLPGATVTAGQLLISGVRDTGTFGAYLVGASGSVTARTWYTLQARMPLTVLKKQATGEVGHAVAVIFGKQRVNFYGNTCTSGKNYDKIGMRTQLRLLGMALPVTLVRERRTFYDAVPVQRTSEQALAAGEALLTAYLHTLVDPHGAVSSTRCDGRREGDVLVVTLAAECMEEIGVRERVYTEENSADR